MRGLKDRVAIVTGASGAIGAATVAALAARGVRIVLAAPVSEAAILNRLAAQAEKAGVQTLVVPTDVTRRADIDNLVARAVERFGAIDVLANVAGVSSTPSLADDTDAGIERVLAVNLLGCARTMHAVLPVMRAQGRGSIVNIGSVAGEAGVLGIYSASKFGLRGLSDSVRREARSWNVGVTLIEPGFVRSPMNAAMGDGLPSPGVVADAVVRAILRPRRRAIVPWYYAFPVFVANAFPWIIDAVFGDARIQERLNRDARAALQKERNAI
jgi:NAD(P)-dependent dehydrogenase (short-subunit alcohol dehydrogenase family)